MPSSTFYNVERLDSLLPSKQEEVLSKWLAEELSKPVEWHEDALLLERCQNSSFPFLPVRALYS